MFHKLKALGAVLGVAALLCSAGAPARAAGDKMSGKMDGKMSAKPAAPAAKCMLTPMVCAHDKAPMKAVNGTTMKCTKCGMMAPAMCAKCQAKLVKGKCPKCGMTMAQLKGDTKPTAKPAAKAKPKKM